MYSVMLVDNEPIIPRGLMQLIDWRGHGCRVMAVARDGADAVRQIQEFPPDIVITDIRMPEMDGLQLCAWVREHAPGIQLILLTGFPDFEYAQQAIQYQVVDFVLKPTTEEALAAAVDKACRQLQKAADGGAEQRSLLLEQQMLLGEMIFHNRHSLLYTLNRLNSLHILLDSYYVLSLDVLSREGAADESAQLQEAQEILEKFCGERKLYFVSRGDSCCYAVVRLQEGEDPAALCAQAVEAADRETDFVLTIGISRRHQNPLQLGEAAREADDAQRFTLYSSQPSVMRCEDLPRLSENTAHVLLEKLRLVESALENRSREAAVKNLEDLCAFMRAEKVPFSGTQQIALLLYNFCLSLLLSHNLSSGSFPEDVSSLHSETPAALELELRSIVQETLLRISRTPGNIDSIIYEVKQYIDENYSASLSLDALAAQVHLSPSYFSKLFKREMGENLSTYILHTRIERARFLLRTTDKKAYEIAEAVGIYDPVYFSKIFKKVTGMKPKEYRDRPDTNK